MDKSYSSDNQLMDLRILVQQILEANYKLDINTTEKIMDTHFGQNYLPQWYFFSNTPDEIAEHIYVISQLLDANLDYIQRVSDDGKSITYFLNIGRDFPGRLGGILHENFEMDIFSYDSVKTLSGIRIITLEKRRNRISIFPTTLKMEVEKFKNDIFEEGKISNYEFTEDFLQCLPESYLVEELRNPIKPKRVSRHMKIYNEVRSLNKPLILTEDKISEVDSEQIETDEKRLVIAIKNPNFEFIPYVLGLLSMEKIAMTRSYYDTFESDSIDDAVGILSIYCNHSADITQLNERLNEVLNEGTPDRKSKFRLLNKLEMIVKNFSGDVPEEDLKTSLLNLKSMVSENSDISKHNEYDNFLLNALSDFMNAAHFLEIENNIEVLKRLIGYNSFDEFFVQNKLNRVESNKPGFRIKHNVVRGKAFKGGLRINPIVEFTEVSALAFMMTWKCARAKILFGGAKGGLMMNPKVYDIGDLEYFDSLSDFGRSLFMITGPSKDVPAGDVGCGAVEIGHMFEGFKSALRDVALIVYGVKKVVGMTGNNRIISVEKARRMLVENFDIDISNQDILRELVVSERYIELVCAAQITGKPHMGVEARTGATGRGIYFGILAMVTRLFLDEKWKIDEGVSNRELALLQKFSNIQESRIIEKNGIDLLTKNDWEELENNIFKKLLSGKTLVVQGIGKVGMSICIELSKQGMDIIALSNSKGAVVGSNIDYMEYSRKNIEGEYENAKEIIRGGKEGTAILELDCDILVTAALENAITAENAERIKAKIVACGANGSNSSKAEIILNKRGIIVLYDFLVSGGGVIASYFEWLRNLTERFRYEAEEIRNEIFNIDVMDQYIMPEFKERIKEILVDEESGTTTEAWNMVLRDIMVGAVNDDYEFARKNDVSMKTAGFVNSILRVLCADLLKSSRSDRMKMWSVLPDKTKSLLHAFFLHPEAGMHSDSIDSVINMLYEN